MSIYSMWGSSLIIAPAGFPVATESAEKGDDVHLCDSRVWWHWKQMPGEQLVFPVQKHGSNLPPALSHLLLFIAWAEPLTGRSQRCPLPRRGC